MAQQNYSDSQAYTIANESKHLFIYGVPVIKLRAELKSLCSKYGQIVSLHVVTDHKTEVFTECYHLHYGKIQSARIAKRQLDNRSFYGGVLHVCYAPERESVEDTRAKLLQRSKDVLSRLYGSLERDSEDIQHNLESNRKRKNSRAENVDREASTEIDPMEPGSKVRKRETVREINQEQLKSRVMCGPQLPEFYLYKQERENISGESSQPLSAVEDVSSKNVEKKIVFHKPS